MNSAKKALPSEVVSGDGLRADWIVYRLKDRSDAHSCTTKSWFITTSEPGLYISVT